MTRNLANLHNLTEIALSVASRHEDKFIDNWDHFSQFILCYRRARTDADSALSVPSYV